MNMKTLLRKSSTGLYFQGLDDWTADQRSAFDFKAPDRALKFVRDARLQKMELVFAFDNPSHNVALPIDERFGLNGAERSAPKFAQQISA